MACYIVYLALFAVLVACILATQENLNAEHESQAAGDETHIRERRWPGMWGFGMRRFRPWGMGYGYGMYGMGYPGMMGWGWGR